MKKFVPLDPSTNIIDILKSIYKGVVKTPYQTRKPEIEHHEQSMDIWNRQNDECSGSGMPYRTR